MNDKAFIDEKKEQEKVPANAVKKMLRPSKPKTKAKKSTLLCFRSSISPAVGSARKKPAPRRSNEHAINGADFMNHLHGASPSPVAFPLRRLRSRANKIQTQPLMPSVEVPDQGHHPYLSPHPRNNSLAQQTPSRLDFLETYVSFAFLHFPYSLLV